MSDELYQITKEISHTSLRSVVADCTGHASHNLSVVIAKDDEPQFGEQVVMLTLSAHTFRVIFTLSRHPAITSQPSAEQAENTASLTSHDQILELVNVYVGDAKRQLQNRVPALGMSTPNVVNKNAFVFMHKTKVDWSHAFVIKHANTPLFFASLFVSVYGAINMDVIEEPAPAGVSELEFF